MQISMERVVAAARNIAITGDPRTSAQVLERFVKTLAPDQKAEARRVYRATIKAGTTEPRGKLFSGSQGPVT